MRRSDAFRRSSTRRRSCAARRSSSTPACRAARSASTSTTATSRGPCSLACVPSAGSSRTSATGSRRCSTHRPPSTRAAASGSTTGCATTRGPAAVRASSSSDLRTMVSRIRCRPILNCRRMLPAAASNPSSFLRQMMARTTAQHRTAPDSPGSAPTCRCRSARRSRPAVPRCPPPRRSRRAHGARGAVPRPAVRVRRRARRRACVPP